MTISSEQLIRDAARRGETSVPLADGDAAVFEPSHIFPDVICKHNGCTAVFDSRTKDWLNGRTGDNLRLIEKRDNWHYGLCPKHYQPALS